MSVDHIKRESANHQESERERAQCVCLNSKIKPIFAS